MNILTQKNKKKLKAIFVAIDYYYDLDTKTKYIPLSKTDIEDLKKLQQQGIYVIPIMVTDMVTNLNTIDQIYFNSFGEYTISSAGSIISNYKNSDFNIYNYGMTFNQTNKIVREVLNLVPWTMIENNDIYFQKKEYSTKFFKKHGEISNFKNKVIYRGNIHLGSKVGLTKFSFGIFQLPTKNYDFSSIVVDIRKNLVDSYNFVFNSHTKLITYTATGIDTLHGAKILCKKLGFNLEENSILINGTEEHVNLANNVNFHIANRFANNEINLTTHLRLTNKLTLIELLKKNDFDLIDYH